MPRAQQRLKHPTVPGNNQQGRLENLPHSGLIKAMPARRRILLIQLPIPQPGMEPAEGNVPLAAGYLKLLARLRGLDDDFEIEILPAKLANRLSDRGLAAEILARDPWLVGWTCYLWNIERSLEISAL